MQTFLILTVTLHVLAGVFWAGTTFVLARNPAATTPGLTRAQTGAMFVALVAGGVLWSLVRPPVADLGTRVLLLGAACAVLAGIAQGLRVALAGGSLRGQRVIQGTATGLLALAVTSMVVARYT